MNNLEIEYDIKSYTDNKSVALMCPQCYELVGTIKQKITTEIFLDKNGRAKFYGHNINFQIDGYCDYCDEYIEEFLTIDADIAASISLLNKKGWKTNFCCSGHENSVDAYIYFRNNKYLKYIATIPKGWKVDVNDYTKLNSFIIRSKYGKYDPTELYEWAKILYTLPDISKIRCTDRDLIENLLNFGKDQLYFNDEETK